VAAGNTFLTDFGPTPFVISSDAAEHDELRVLLASCTVGRAKIDPHPEHSDEPLCAAVATAAR
jgi:hypothetical protein